MAKRFISPDWKLLRRLPEHLQRAWFYIWDKADACGVYTYDPDYLQLDLSLTEAITLTDLSTLPNTELLSDDRVLLKDFLQVNYGTLRPDYNPHKPVFRDLEKNKLKVNLSLVEACVKLEDKEEEEDKLIGTVIVVGAEKFKFPGKPVANDIPEPDGETIRLVHESQYRIGNTTITPEIIKTYWLTWVATEYNGKKYSPGLDDVYKHFVRQHAKNKIHFVAPTTVGGRKKVVL